MPEIELPPGKYRFRRPLSKPLAWGFVALGAGMLWWVWSVRDNLTADTLFGSAAFVAACLGGLLATIFRDVD